jgi:phosphopantetheinyl transferase
MPLFYFQEVTPNTKLAIWKIEEQETFFLEYVPLPIGITHPKKRLQHLAGRYLLQYLFSDFPLESIQIASTRKPYLEDEQYHFSISHSGDYAAAIVSSTDRIGIDVEFQRITFANIAHKFLHKEEIAAVSLTDLASLTVFWCAKEAIFKWWGLGDVDFSETIRIEPFAIAEEGELSAKLIKHNAVFALKPQYKIFDNLCLVFVSIYHNN